MIAVDVLVVGAGPAGCALALCLGPSRRALMVDRDAEPRPRIGEALAPAARRLLADMGILAAFEAQGHARCHAHRVAWGAAAPSDVDLLRNLDGPGWHLDRPRFEAWLRAEARARGAGLLAPASLSRIARDGSGWLVGLDTPAGFVEVRARVVVDAGGRRAPVARALGGRRRALDRLVCGWIEGTDGTQADRGVGLVAAMPQGWWYSSPLPGGRRLLALQTDADRPAARLARSGEGLLAAARETPAVAALLVRTGFRAASPARFTAAHGCRLDPAAGEGWLAAGDAALSLDPLAARGIFNALFTGFAGAEAADRHLAGDPDALPGHARLLARLADAYERERAHWYVEEARWPGEPFWARRRGLMAA